MKILLTICMILIFSLNSSQGERFIYLEPGGITMKYLGDDLSLTCHHSIVGRPMWLANGSLIENDSNPLNPFVEFINTPPSFNYSEITINDMTEIVNGSQIECFIETSISSVCSNNLTILLQGKLDAVGNLNYILYDNYIQITWSPPFTLISELISKILYQVVIQNQTSQVVNITTISETNYEIYPVTSRLITCDDLFVTVSPMNKLGLGNNSTLSIQSQEILDSNATALFTFNKQVDILLGVNSYICSISNVTVKNVNLNNVTSYTLFDKFIRYEIVGGPQYLLATQLQRRFTFQIEMTLKNTRGSLTKTFNISTHQIDNFQTSERDGHLYVTIIYADSMEEHSGGYLMLLYCQNSQCNSFNYSNSIFLPTRNVGEVMINHGSYYSGMYKIFVFDTNPDGSIASSPGINSAFSLPPNKIRLTMGRLSGPTSSRSICQFQYNNESVLSTCNTEEYGKQQVIQIPANFAEHQGLIISNSSSLKSLCVPKSNQTEFILSIPVGDEFSHKDQEPLGMNSILEVEYSSNLHNCDKVPSEDVGKLPTYAYVLIGLASLFFLICILVTIICCCYRYCCSSKESDRVVFVHGNSNSNDSITAAYQQLDDNIN